MGTLSPVLSSLRLARLGWLIDEVFSFDRERLANWRRRHRNTG
ncbi:hypothetical protein PWG15_20930 (plasmid) [Ensifer adhaerens]|nr:hypothetical protein [Ensifer adhaerens]WDZ80264.1 hypothetical protein PWG15_20930 [Ensifer adhaerens]